MQSILVYTSKTSFFRFLKLICCSILGGTMVILYYITRPVVLSFVFFVFFLTSAAYTHNFMTYEIVSTSYSYNIDRNTHSINRDTILNSSFVNNRYNILHFLSMYTFYEKNEYNLYDHSLTESESDYFVYEEIFDLNLIDEIENIDIDNSSIMENTEIEEVEYEDYNYYVVDHVYEPTQPVYVLPYRQDVLNTSTYWINGFNNSPLTNRGATHWSDASNLFPRESNATILDVVTGQTFRVRRTFGSNHADIEPLTRHDSAVIYSIWNGNSWAQRAIVVITDTGSIIAASMNGYPHAGLDRYPALATVDNRSGGFGRGINLDSIKGNGVDGHFCIHFYGSTTHTTRRVHPGHQNMVQVASQFIRDNF